jgi:hypothetical protein
VAVAETVDEAVAADEVEDDAVDVDVANVVVEVVEAKVDEVEDAVDVDVDDVLGNVVVDDNAACGTGIATAAFAAGITSNRL